MTSIATATGSATAVATATATATAEPLAVPRVESETRTDPALPWRTVVWDDPVNLMSYVTYVFRTHFGYPEAKAQTLMLAVHEEGRAVVSSGSRERMEADVEAMHRYGLWATLEQES